VIALLATAALAGDFLTTCEAYSPIGGTAGFDNALAAVRTNAQTYGAGSFARERMKWDNVLALDFHIVAGAAQVPMYCADVEGKYTEEVYSQPLDLGATNLGFALPFFDEGPLNSRFRVFYASSVTQSVFQVRSASWSLPLLNLYPATFAPLVGRSSTGRSVQAYAVDWIGGAYFGSDVISLQAGYTGTRGLYVDLEQEKIALFVNTVVSDGFSLADAKYLLGGLERFDLLNLGFEGNETIAKIGMLSLFYRDLPQTESQRDETGSEPNVIDRLRTGHFRQEDIYGMFDVRTSVQLGEQGGLRELAAAFHAPGWHPRRTVELPDEYRLFYVRAGVIRLPDQPTFGVQGGLRPTIRADLALHNSGAPLGLRASLRMNDPDLLDLYPFAYNALGINVEMTSSMEWFD
jgi:hypothetical protein